MHLGRLNLSNPFGTNSLKGSRAGELQRRHHFLNVCHDLLALHLRIEGSDPGHKRGLPHLDGKNQKKPRSHFRSLSHQEGLFGMITFLLGLLLPLMFLTILVVYSPYHYYYM